MIPEPMATLPEELSSDIRNVVRVMIDAAQREGWNVTEVRLTSGIIFIAATSPDGGGINFACAENQLIERLRMALLKSKSPE